MSSSNTNSSKFVQAVKSASTRGETPIVDLLFSGSTDGEPCTPTFQISSLKSRSSSHRMKIDAVCCISFPGDVEKIHITLCSALSNLLDHYLRAFSFHCGHSKNFPRTLSIHNFRIEDSLFLVFYPEKVDETTELLWRQELHDRLSLPEDKPSFRRGQALHPVPCLAKWLGPNEETLVCPHEHLKPPPGSGTVYVIQGRYTYKHYLQDNTDDKNWGCAYRSLQTLISWLMWQGEVAPKRLPSIKDIQSSLVRTGDKPKNFIGSRQWIGSLEVSFCLDELYGIQCRLLPVSQGSQMASTASVLLSQHFASGGGPVMIGGGQLAHTIIGVQLPDSSIPAHGSTKSAQTPRYLVLDPHYTGPMGSLKQILDKGWCGWKDESFWKPSVHYNLCFLPPISPGRV